MRNRMLMCMQSTSVRVDRATHDEIKRLSTAMGKPVGETVRLAVRRLAQQRMGAELATGVTSDEVAWLDADLG